MEITTKPFFLFSFFFFFFFLHTWLYLLMTPALIMLVVPGLPSYNGVEVYYLKGVIGLPIVISFRDRWYTHIFFFWKWAHWWRHRHRLDRFRFQNFQSPGQNYVGMFSWCDPEPLFWLQEVKRCLWACITFAFKLSVHSRAFGLIHYTASKNSLGDSIHTSFSAIFYKGDNFCDLLFALLHTNPLLKRGLL